MLCYLVAWAISNSWVGQKIDLRSCKTDVEQRIASILAVTEEQSKQAKGVAHPKARGKTTTSRDVKNLLICKVLVN